MTASPVTMAELGELMQAIGWTDDDARAIARAGEVFVPRAEAMVDGWRAVIAAQPHLLRWFLRPDGTPDEPYRAAVKQRFVQWVRDTCQRPYDRAWLDQQHEIGLRHTPAKKNVTDGGHTPPLVPLRFVLAFADVIAASGRRHLAQAGRAGDELEAMASAWRKTVHLQVALWSLAYARDGLW